jgi:hypothetical protein
MTVWDHYQQRVRWMRIGSTIAMVPMFVPSLFLVTFVIGFLGEFRLQSFACAFVTALPLALGLFLWCGYFCLDRWRIGRRGAMAFWLLSILFNGIPAISGVFPVAELLADFWRNPEASELYSLFSVLNPTLLLVSLLSIALVAWCGLAALISIGCFRFHWKCGLD